MKNYIQHSSPRKSNDFTINAKKLIDEEGELFFIGLFQILEDNDLKAQEKLLFFTIWSLAQNYGYCSASNRFLGGKLNLKTTQLSTYLNSLDAKGYIIASHTPSRPPYGRKRHVFINFDKLSEAGRRKFRRSRSKSRQTERNLH